jgi:hypothetical protein
MNKPISPERAFQNAVKAALADADCQIDRVICRKNGNIEIKRSYFYRFDYSAARYAADAADVLESAGISARVSSEDRRAEWPKASYFVAVIMPVMA